MIAQETFAPARFPAGPKPITRFVAVGRVGESRVSDDVWVVEPDVPVRRLLRRIFPSVSAHGGWRKALAGAVPFLTQPTNGVPRLLELGVDDEGRVCLVFEELRAQPRWLTMPRTFAEAARLALDAVNTAAPLFEVLGKRRPLLSAADVEVGVGGDVCLPRVGLPALPPELGGDRELLVPGALSPAATAAGLVAGFGFPLPRHVVDTRVAWDVLSRAAAPDLPWRSRALAGQDARRFLEALADSDVDELARVQAALALSRARDADDEIARQLVRCLNEPLAWLPRVALEILSEWPAPFGLRVDDSGLLCRCPHPWACTEVVSELGGSSVERHCPDCDARVVLPQSAAFLAPRCDVARAFVDGLDESEPVEVIEPGRRRPLWRGQSILLAGAVEIVNIGGGRLCLRRRTLVGEREIEPFLPGARIRCGDRIWRCAADGIVVDRALD